ncbi:MAG: hypothetical protein JWO19_2159 [Bryobacterales bacterium]|jgi:hypothetical protein|nr:hypothetical protein [Bryobacterales bacterium]
MQPKTSDRLHAAIQTGAWSTAQELLASFRLEVEASWRAAATEQERRDISDNVTGFLQWARAMTLTSREQARAHLNRLDRRQAYAGPHASNPHRGINA